ncbi:EamA family transporter [Pseudomonas sp.]|uniref:EamA family transporter n=1 Tax=Pseudomonas sp. TaxID=306 RepID=UPI003C77C241
MHSHLLTGVLCLLGFSILSAARDIALEGHFKVDNPYDYLFIVFGLAAIFYAAVNFFKSTSGAPRKAAKYTENIIWLNLVTAGNWVGLFLALKYLSPPSVAALYAGTIPAATLIVNRLLRSESALTKADWISTILLLACATAWAFVNISSLQGSQAATGFAYVVLSSFTIAATTVFSKRLADSQIPTSKIMAHRFYILVGISYFMSSPSVELLDVAVRNYQLLLIVAAAGTILSLWLLQKGIEKCEPVLTEVVIATSPVVSLALYTLFVGGETIKIDTIVMSVSVVSIAVFHTLFQYKNESHREITQ